MTALIILRFLKDVSMTQSSITGVVKVKGVPDTACFTTFSDLLRALGQYLTVEFTNQEFTNVVISYPQPSFADRDKIWWRLNANGQFIGLYKFATNDWAQIYPAPQQIFWLYGDSSNPPPGFSFNTVSTLFTNSQYASLISQAIVGTTPGTFVYYPAVYVGV